MLFDGKQMDLMISQQLKITTESTEPTDNYFYEKYFSVISVCFVVKKGFIASSSNLEVKQIRLYRTFFFLPSGAVRPRS